MPYVRKLSAAEIATAEQRPLSERARIAREYDVYLSDFAPGDRGRVELAVGEVRLRVRSWLQAAARRRGLALHFRPGPGPALIFRVEVAPPPKARPLPPPAGSSAQREGGVASQREPARRLPPRRRETSTERYHKVLPRWMREGGQGRRRNGSKRRVR
jgi:hypothetical protein